MKKFLFIFSFVSLLAITGLVFNSCDIKSPIEGVDVLFSAPPIVTNVSFEIFDAKTGTQIGLGDVYKTSLVTIEGIDKGKVIDYAGVAKTTFETKVGIVNFAILETVTPTAAAPINLILVVESDGYIQSSLPISITKIGSHSFAINLVNPLNPPIGVGSASNTAGVSNNGTIAALVAVEGVDNKTKASASLSVPAGVIVKDANGNNVSGALKTTVTYFNSLDETALRSFPGGFMVNTNTNGRGTFTTAGFASFEITNAAGTEVKSFSAPVNFKMQVPAGTFNPATGAAVKNGDLIPIWSYNEDTGQWTKEGSDGTAVGPDANGNFTVSFSSNHLSSWNLDWFNGDFCATGLSLTITGNFTQVQLKIKRQSNNTYISTSGWATASDPVVSMQYVPRNLPVVIEAYTGCGTLVGSVNVTDLCGSNINLPVNVQQQNPISVTVTVSGYCPSTPNVLVRPYGSIYIKDECGWRYGGYMVLGNVTFSNIVLGKTYTFGVWYDGSWYEHPYTVTQSTYNYSFAFPANLCQ